MTFAKRLVLTTTAALAFAASIAAPSQAILRPGCIKWKIENTPEGVVVSVMFTCAPTDANTMKFNIQGTSLPGCYTTFVKSFGPVSPQHPAVWNRWYKTDPMKQPKNRIESWRARIDIFENGGGVARSASSGDFIIETGAK